MHVETGIRYSEVVQTGKSHEPCPMCFPRAQRRKMTRDAKRRHAGWKCCAIDARTGAREHDLGKHEHAAQLSAHDHRTGAFFWAADPSATRAIKRRMLSVQFWLRNEESPEGFPQA